MKEPSRKEVGESETSNQLEAKSKSHNIEQEKLKKPSIAYINSLPAFKSALLQQGKPKRDSGTTSEMSKHLMTNVSLINN